jgi:hypothetical protein
MLHMEDMLKDHANIKDDLTERTAEELAIIGKGEKGTDAVTEEVMDKIFHFTQNVLWSSSEVVRVTRGSGSTLHVHFPVCPLCLSTWASLDCDRRSQGPEAGIVANDFVDSAIAAYATSFNGLITNDKLAMSIYKNVTRLLDSGFLRNDSIPKRSQIRSGT